MRSRGLNRIARCRGCGQWRYRHRDLRECPACVLINLHRAMEKARGA